MRKKKVLALLLAGIVLLNSSVVEAANVYAQENVQVESADSQLEEDTLPKDEQSAEIFGGV